RAILSAAGAKDLLSVAFHPDIGPPVPDQPAVMSTGLADIEHVASDRAMPPVPRRRDAPAGAPAQLVLPVPDGLPCSDDVDRAIYAMHDGDPVAQPAGVLDLDGDVEEPVAVEVAELIGWVELRRERELTTQARRDQSAVGPAREASEGRARDLGGRRCDTEKSDGQYGFHMHIRDTPARWTPLGNLCTTHRALGVGARGAYTRGHSEKRHGDVCLPEPAPRLRVPLSWRPRV